MTVMVNAFDILQDRIMRSRLAGDPPDALIQLKVGKIGMFEFNRADELIAIGRDAVRRAAAMPHRAAAIASPTPCRSPRAGRGLEQDEKGRASEPQRTLPRL